MRRFLVLVALTGAACASSSTGNDTPPAAATPAFSPPEGTYDSPQSVSIATATAGATIHYTSDGSTPAASSPTYVSAISVAATTTLKAIATASGYNDSAVASATYTMLAATPVLSPAPGTYATAQSVTITTATPGATIHYTTDGSTPAASSPTYASAISLPGPGPTTTTIKAIAIRAGFTDSAVASATYTIETSTAVAATPAFSPPAGTYSTAQDVTISSTTAGAVIHCTTDGSAPTASSPTCASPVHVAATTTVQAIATATGYAPSSVASATYVIGSFPGVLTYHYDNLRSGLNPNETVLTPANVNQTVFGKKFSLAVDGQVYTQPLYAPAIAISGQGLHDVVYVATEHDSVYAFDADGVPATPLWQVSFIDPAAGVTTVPPADTGECCDLSPEIGITSTPVIDPSSETIYVVAKTKEVAGASTSYVQRLHALDIATGAEKFGGPVVIQASVPGTGDGSSAGQVPFIPLRENQREALLLVNGMLVIAFASHGDNGPYHGWVIGYDATTLGQIFAFNDTPDGGAGGIWQSGCGPAADAAGDIYFISGNGTFDASGAVLQLSDTFTKLSPGGTVVDYFTPWNQPQISAQDFDLGSGGTLLLPDQPGAHPHLMISAGKEGTVYVVDRDTMGHQGATSDSQIVQVLVHVLPGNSSITSGNFSAPAHWNDRVYFGAVDDAVKMFTLSGGQLSTAPISQTGQTFAFPGGFPAISSNGAASAILWVVERPSSGTPGVLHAYDATDLSIELYNSNQNAIRDGLDLASKFMVPTVANGKVFIGTNSTLTAFGPL